MKLKNFFQKFKKEINYKSFNGFEFNSKKKKKITYFLLLKEIKLMVMIT